ncbi:MAG: hypothetical protein H7X84_08135 [Verrucomicrobia bacterium]|nr:hypothetical protein [Prolixibacteraceae bacterium]
MKQLFFITMGLSILLLASCSAPRSIIKLKPQSQNTSWFYGQEFTGDSVFGIITKVAFDQVSQPWYLFDVEITNRSNMSYLVDPTSIFCVPLNGTLQPFNGDTLYAVDPETKVDEIDKEMSVNAARQKNQLGLTLLAAGIDIATGVVVLTDDNPRNDYFRTDLLPATIAQGQENRFEAIDLNELRDTWRSTTIRKTTLEPGYAMHGKILVPIVPDASYIQFNVPVDNELIRINFMQLKTKP